jgi:hypothetical protein
MFVRLRRCLGIAPAARVASSPSLRVLALVVTLAAAGCVDQPLPLEATADADVQATTSTDLETTRLTFIVATGRDGLAGGDGTL